MVIACTDDLFINLSQFKMAISYIEILDIN